MFKNLCRIEDAPDNLDSNNMLDPSGPTLLLLTVVLLGVLTFLPTIPLLDGGMPPMTWR